LLAGIQVTSGEWVPFISCLTFANSSGTIGCTVGVDSTRTLHTRGARIQYARHERVTLVSLLALADGPVPVRLAHRVAAAGALRARVGVAPHERVAGVAGRTAADGAVASCLGDDSIEGHLTSWNTVLRALRVDAAGRLGAGVLGAACVRITLVTSRTRAHRSVSGRSALGRRAARRREAGVTLPARPGGCCTLAPYCHGCSVAVIVVVPARGLASGDHVRASFNSV